MGVTPETVETGGGLLEGWPLVREFKALAGGRLCQGQRRRQCRVESGEFADWACRSCREWVRPEAISPWSWHLYFLHQLKEAGYPFKANDLSLETWLLLRWAKSLLSDSGRGGDGQREY